jgi:DNA invertase Pin-like site-specific DNA recombinase
MVGVPLKPSLRPENVDQDCGRHRFDGRILWTDMPGSKTGAAPRPQNGRLRDGMGGILGYARVSTSDQDVAGQTTRLTEAGAIKVFTDVRSGKTMERPGLEALLAYARDGDTLAVVRLDRLGRSLGELLTTVAMLKERGIALLSLEERIDTNSAAGELVFHVFGAIAHFERRLIAERTRDGIAAARARGKRPGRHPLDPEKIAAALELVKAGLSPTVAARQLGLGRSTVYREVGRAGIAR